MAVAILTAYRFTSTPQLTCFQHPIYKHSSAHMISTSFNAQIASHPELPVTLTCLQSRSDAGHPQVSSTMLNPRASRPAATYRCAW
jgi:hypothetical protein